MSQTFNKSSNIQNSNDFKTLLDAYIFSEKSADALNRILDSVNDRGSTKAFSITGPYGTGKSSFAILLRSLLGSANSTNFKISSKKLEKHNTHLHNKLIKIRTKNRVSTKGFTYVPVVGEKKDLVSSFGDALLEHVKNSDYSKPKNWTTSNVMALLKKIMKTSSLIIIIDEFGKFLEFSAEKPESEDLYLMQLIAEEISSSKNKNSLLITLQHMSFTDYSISLSFTQKKEWAKVHGRFEDISFLEGLDHNLDVLSGLLEKYINTNKKIDTKLATKFSKEWADAGLGKLINLSTTRIKKLINFHPLAAVALIDFSNRFGQSDRSLFSFILSDEPGSYKKILQQREKQYITFSDVCNFFLTKGYQEGTLGNVDTTTAEIINNLSQAKSENMLLVEAVAGLNILSQSYDIKTNIDYLSFALDKSKKETKNDLERIVKNKIVTYRKYSKEYKLWQGSDVDIEQTLSTVRNKFTLEPLKSLLPSTEIFSNAVAVRHFHNYGILRFFQTYLIESKDELKELLKENHKFDGLILIVSTSELSIKDVPNVTNLNKPILRGFTKNLGPVRELAIERASIEHLIQNTENNDIDKVASLELKRRFVNINLQINSYLQDFYSLLGKEVKWYIKDQKTEITTSKDLSEAISKLSDDTYKENFILFNDMLQQNKLSSQGTAARRNLLENMITHPTKENFNLEGFGPEVSMYFSIFNKISGNFHTYDKALSEWKLKKPSSIKKDLHGKFQSQGFKGTAWKTLDSELKRVNKKITLDQLREVLLLPPFGMREGVVDLFLVVYLFINKNSIAVYQENDYVPDLTIQTIEKLLKRPDKFFVRLIKDNKRLDEITNIIIKDLGLKELENIRNASTLSIIAPIVRSFNNLPDYSRKTKLISKDAQQLRNVVLMSREPEVLLFEKMPQAFGMESFLKSKSVSEVTVKKFAKKLEKNLSEVTNSYAQLLEDIEKVLRDCLPTKIKEFNDVRAELKVIANRLSEVNIDKNLKPLFMYFQEDSYNREDWLSAIALATSGRPAITWDDDDLKNFKESYRLLFNKILRIESLYVEKRRAKKGFRAVRITTTDQQGNEDYKIVDINQEFEKELQTSVEQVKDLVGKNDFSYEELIAFLTSDMVRGEKSLKKELQSDKEIKKEIKKKNG
jgi:hypothetical protein